MYRRRAVVLALWLAATSCSKTLPDTSPGLKVLTGKAATIMLRQCSRHVPNHGPTYWQPKVSDVLALEALLPVTLQQTHPEENWKDFPQKWGRRYVGIVRSGKHFIYGDYFPAGSGDVCDGGPRFFGAEYDVQTKRISHLAFNGAA